MIPPISPDVLSSNPQFASLHKALTTKYLDQDASTKSTNTSHRPVEEQTQKYLTQTSKENILSQALHDIALSNDEKALPGKLRELIYIIATYLLTSPSLTTSQIALLSQEIEKVNPTLPDICTLLSQTLQSQHTHLRSLAKLTSSTNPSTGSKPWRYSLQAQLKDTSTSLSTLHQSTTAATTTLINTLTHLLSLHTSQLVLQLTHLSRYTHGSLSRHVLSKSNHLSTLSHALASKTQILALEARRSTYSAQTQVALANYAAHLDGLKEDLDTRIRALEDELRLYAECDGRGGKTIEELGRRYGDVLAEIEGVRADVERLEQAGKAGDGSSTDGRRGDSKFSGTMYEGL